MDLCLAFLLWGWPLVLTYLCFVYPLIFMEGEIIVLLKTPDVLPIHWFLVRKNVFKTEKFSDSAFHAALGQGSPPLGHHSFPPSPS